MNKQLEEYKKLIDALAHSRPAVEVRWVEKGWPSVKENREVNEFLAGLAPEQKRTLQRIVQHARDGGIHDVLAYLNDEVSLKGLRISRNGVEFAIEPYGSEMYWDWFSRSEGNSWPEQQLNDRYRLDDSD